MQKVDFHQSDGSEVVFTKKEGGHCQSHMEFPRAVYFEVDVVQGSDMAIEIKSDVDKIIYRGAIGELWNSGDKTVTNIQSVKRGDVLGCILWLSMSEGNKYSLVQFTINKKNICPRNIYIQGEMLQPIVYCNPDNTKVELSVIDSEDEQDLGNFSLLYHQKRFLKNHFKDI